MPKLDFDEVTEMINNEMIINHDDVKASVLNRKVWVNANGLPGYMYDHQGINMSKKDAIESCKLVAGEYPRGFVTGLRKYENADINGYRYSIYQATIGELL